MAIQCAFGVCALAALVSLQGCVSRKFGESSQVAHDSAKPVFSPQRWQWAEPTVDQHLAMLRLDNSSTLPASHPVTKRLQFWVDAIDSRLRQKHSADFKFIPRPVVLPIKSEEINAFVANVSVCYPVKTMIAPQSHTFEVDKVVAFFPSSGRVLSATQGDASAPGVCAMVRDEAALRAVVALHNSQVQGGTSCRLAQENGTLSFQGKCNMEAVAGEESNGTLFSFPATSHFVSVFSGILRILDEDQMVAVLAHELGHYYRSHATAAVQRSAYFYARNSDRAPGQPPALWRDDLRSDYDSLSRYSGLSIPKRLPGALHSLPGLSRTLLVPPDDLNALCTSDACKEAWRLFLTGRNLSDLHAVVHPRAAATPEQLMSYAAAEKSFVRFLGTISADDMRHNFDATAGLLLSLDGYSDLDFVRGVLDGVRAGKHPTALSAMESIEGKYQVLEKEIQTKIDRVVSAGFGWYTIEEEADSLSVEFMAMLGKKPRLASRPYFEFMKLFAGVAPSVPFMDFGYEECKALYDADWKKDGKKVSIPFDSTVGEVHHTNCFRVYNIDREIERHGFRDDAASEVKVPAGSPTWSEVIAQLPAPEKDGGVGDEEFTRAIGNACQHNQVDCTFVGSRRP